MEYYEKIFHHKDIVVEKKTVTKIPHPEMAEVQHGDELLVVKFGEEEIERSFTEILLQNRIDEIEDPWDNEDDDGGLIVRK